MSSGIPQKFYTLRLAEYLATFPDQARMGDGIFASHGNTSIKLFQISVKDKTDENNTINLYRIELYLRSEIIAPDSYKHESIEIADRSGLYNIEIEFNPTNVEGEKFTIRGDEIISKADSSIRLPVRKGMRDRDFEGWIKSVCSLMDEKVCFIPDTNFIRRQYYSHYFKDLFESHKDQFLFILSRLVILEIENKYNKSSKILKGLEKNPSPLENKQKQEQFKAQSEINLGFHTIKEIILMKHDGINVLPAIDTASVKAFLDGAGADLGDPWIRNEILKFVSSKQVIANQELILSKKPKPKIEYVFLTCDKMNALAATAENLDTFYISRPENITDLLIEGRRSGDLDYRKLSSLLVNTAIHYGECQIEVIPERGTPVKFRIRGNWVGKTTNDWKNESVLIEPT